MTPLRMASVCSGIGGAELAFDGLAHSVFMSEIDAFPRTVLKQHFPHVTLHGDFTGIETDEPVDVLVGGTPCQSFSVAGLRRGMADERGNLALQFLRLASRLRARWVLWENVPGVLSSSGGRDFGSFLGGLAELGYGWAYRVLDAQYFGLAQRRKRVFVVGCLGDWRRAAAVLFEPASLRGNSAPRREAGQRTTGTLSSCAGTERKHGHGWGQQEWESGFAITLEDEGVARTPLGKANSSHREDAETYIAFNWQSGGDNRSCPSVGLANSLQRSQTQAIAFGGNRQSGSLDISTAVNAHVGPHGRLDFETETFVAYSIMPQNSGRDYKARPVNVAQPVMAGGPAGGNQGGDYIVTHALTAPSGRGTVTEDGTGRGTPLVAVPLLEIGKGSSSRGAGPNGAGFGNDGDPMFTLQAGAQRGIAFQSSQSGVREHDTHATLDANNGSRRYNGVVASGVRRLTPTECERLQGYPDGWTDVEHRGKPAADGPRYKALGNAFAVPVVRWIARRLTREALQ